MLNPINRQQGFTLFEMLVVVAIVIIMTGVILANLPDFKSASSADLVAQEIAIYTRSAQAYITKVGITTGSTPQSEIYKAYGINFSDYSGLSDEGVPYNKFFFLYGYRGDILDDDYDESLRRKQEQYSLPGDFYFKNIVVKNSSEEYEPVRVDVYFIRPDIEANFECLGADCGDSSKLTEMHLCLASKRSPSRVRKISIYKNGHIVVEQVNEGDFPCGS